MTWHFLGLPNVFNSPVIAVKVFDRLSYVMKEMKTSSSSSLKVRIQVTTTECLNWIWLGQQAWPHTQFTQFLTTFYDFPISYNYKTKFSFPCTFLEKQLHFGSGHGSHHFHCDGRVLWFGSQEGHGYFCLVGLGVGNGAEECRNAKVGKECTRPFSLFSPSAFIN